MYNLLVIFYLIDKRNCVVKLQNAHVMYLYTYTKKKPDWLTN